MDITSVRVAIVTTLNCAIELKLPNVVVYNTLPSEKEDSQPPHYMRTRRPYL